MTKLAKVFNERTWVRVMSGVVLSIMLVGMCGIKMLASDQQAALPQTTGVSNLYSRVGIVVVCDAVNDTVVVEDAEGWLYAFDGVEDWRIGDTCAMVMDSQGTSNIEDDAIVATTYQSWELDQGRMEVKR